MRGSIGAIYSSMNEKIDNSSLRRYVTFFFVRRMVLSFSVVFNSKLLVVQFLTFIMTAIAQIILIGYVKPYKERSDNTQEILNEVISVVIMYHIFCFTDWLPDAHVKYNLGYSCLAFNFFNIATNLVAIFTRTL